MSFISLVIFFLLSVAGSLAKDGNTTLSCFAVEINALLKFKASFSDPSRRLLSWNSRSIDCCKWHGIQCDKITRHVIGVDLKTEVFNYDSVPARLTSGKLDSSIMELKHLSILDLSGNDFQLGYIPTSIDMLNQLQYLNLSHANFSGFVPHQLGNLSRLSVLDLNGQYTTNSLIVDDFTWMSRLSSLTHLDMSYVNLTSTKDLPKVLNMPSIVSLSLQERGLGNENVQHACVINSTTFLPNIKYLDLSSNSLGGDFPCFLENLTSLKDLDLYGNAFQWTSDGTSKFIQNNCNLESLNLGFNLLSGNISIFENLTSLRDLDLSRNRNPGDWTSERTSKLIQNNCDLKSLNLEYNYLAGDISNIFRPNSSKCLRLKLAKLNLNQNHFYGQLPEEVGGFEKLEYLDLSFNNISGPIPTSICNLSALTTLNLYRNKLNGSVPSCFGNLTSLKQLALFGNNLEGEIPTSLGQLKNLERLWIEDNYFCGTIIESHLANLSKLQELYIGNDLTKLRVRSDWTPSFQLRWLSIDSCEIEGGMFPKWLQTQKELTYLNMPNCSISGVIPDWFQYKNLIELVLSDNRIEGSLPESLCEMSSLTTLDLSRNQLSGYLPECLDNLTSLQALMLSSNQISGVIPNSIGGANSLSWLQLSDNNITGEFPSSLRNCTMLNIIDVGQNKLSGRLPAWIGKDLLSLEDLRISDNEFYGTIPFELCRLPCIKMMEFANNKLTGKIPHCFGNFSSMAIGQPCSSSSRGGSSIQAVTKGAEVEYSDMLLYVAIIDLSNNDMVGEIPLELTKLDALNGINLSHNHLRGMIPGRIGEMKSLESLDFSNNNLFGSIPASLSDLDSLGFLNLSHNNLSGQIPTGRHLQTLDNLWNYEGNLGLCGAPLLNKCNGNKLGVAMSGMSSQTDVEEQNNYRIWFYGVVISGFATGFWGAIGVLLFKRSWRFAYFRFADDIIERFF